MLLWLSFCDGERPQGTQFLGVAIVEVPYRGDVEETVRAGITKTHRLGINPGGEVLTFEIPPEGEERARSHADRLMQLEEIERVFGPSATPAETESLRETAKPV